MYLFQNRGWTNAEISAEKTRQAQHWQYPYLLWRTSSYESLRRTSGGISVVGACEPGVNNTGWTWTQRLGSFAAFSHGATCGREVVGGGRQNTSRSYLFVKVTHILLTASMSAKGTFPNKSKSTRNIQIK
jgi:hypothetical protein